MPKNKYDLEILMPVSNKGIFGGRLFNFKKYGLLNTGGCKIKFVALIGTQTIENIKEDWDENIEIVSIPYFNDHPAAKVYDFYANQDPNELNADWYMRIDDDTITSIEGLMKNLSNFKPSDKHYFATFLHFLWDGIIEKKILSDLKYPPEIIEAIRHEHECSIVSHASMKNILSNKKSIEIFKIRSSYPIEVCDRCFGCGAYIAGERPIDVPWLDRENKVCRLSCFGGNIDHVHEVSYDKNEASYNFVIDKLKIKQEKPITMKYKVIQQTGYHGMGHSEPFEIGILDLEEPRVNFNEDYSSKMNSTPSSQRMSGINQWLTSWLYQAQQDNSNSILNEILLVDECGLPLGQFTETNDESWMGTLWEGFNVYKLIPIISSPKPKIDRTGVINDTK